MPACVPAVALLNLAFELVAHARQALGDVGAQPAGADAPANAQLATAAALESKAGPCLTRKDTRPSYAALDCQIKQAEFKSAQAACV